MKSISFGDSPAMADELLALVLSGKKTATTGATEDASSDEVGERIIIQDGREKPRAIIQITEVSVRKFNDVDDSFAYDEGEGDRTLEYWRKEHKDFFTREGTYADDMEVCCERFKLIEVLGD
jgi:uncharacterized protein YhfF